MKKNSWLSRLLAAIIMLGAGIAVVSIGTTIGNNGLKNQLNKWKDDITNKINPDDKKDDSSTSAKAAKKLAVAGQEIAIEFAD